MFFSPEGWPQEVAALAFVALAVLYMVHRLTGWPRRRGAAPEPAPDRVQLGGRLSRGLKKVERDRRAT